MRSLLSLGRTARRCYASRGHREDGEGRRGRAVCRTLSGAAFATVAAITLCSPSAHADKAESCPNASLRGDGLSANLPDCRAYEAVSPIDKNGGDIEGSGISIVASWSGDSVSYGSRTGFGDTTGSGGVGLIQYLGTRGTKSWSTRGLTPTPAVNTEQVFGSDTWLLGFSEDMSHALVEALALPSVPGGVAEEMNLYREDTASRELVTITTPLGSEPVGPFQMFYAPRAYSGDLGVITFQTSASMLAQTDGTGESTKLYAWEHGTLTLAGILPDGSIPPGGSADARGVNLGGVKEPLEKADTVSRDGSRIIFTSPVNESAPAQLYMRKDGTSTAWISESEASTPNPEPQGIKFQAASSDGREVLFTSDESLTVGGEPGLYLYTDGPSPASESNLTFIGQGAMVIGMSDDATRIYFLSGSKLYLWDRVSLHVIADPIEIPKHWARVSSDGRRLAFLNEVQLTGQGTDGHTAMYVYDAESKVLSCVSCPPSGGAMASNVELEPRATSEAAEIGLPFRKRFLSSDGRYVFFSTADALVKQDTNKLYDVYEYDADTHIVSLISSGAGEDGSWFGDASASGNDMFFVTRQSLAGADGDRLVDLYDARVDGGMPEPPPPGVPCAGDACQGTPSAAPTFNSASGFVGLGNQSRVPRPAVRGKRNVLTRGQKLARALRACMRQPKAKRAACKSSARKRYGPTKSGKRVLRRAGHQGNRGRS